MLIEKNTSDDAIKNFEPDSFRSLRATMAYMRLARLSVTPEELYRLLWCPDPHSTYENFLSILDKSGARRVNGFVCYNDEDQRLVEECGRSVIPTELMLRRARRAARLVAWVPFLEAVFVCNSVGSETARPESDIDWLVITRPGRIWLVRALLNVILRMAGLRTYGNHEAGRICLSFFIDHDHLDLGSLRALPEDIHFAYWLYQMVPVYGRSSWYPRFLAANTWTQRYLPFAHQFFVAAQYESLLSGRLIAGIKQVLELIFEGRVGNFLERLTRAVQYRKLKLSLKVKAQNPDTGVVIKSGVLKFHEHDTRRDLHELWVRAINS